MTYKVKDYTTNEFCIATDYTIFLHIMTRCCYNFITGYESYGIDFKTIQHKDNGLIIYRNECTTEYLLQLARCLVIDCINCNTWGDVAEVEIID